MSKKSGESSMLNPFAADATRAALRALTRPLGAEDNAPPLESASPESPAAEAEKSSPLTKLGPRTVILSDAEVLAAQEFGYLRGCRDLSAVLRAALETMLEAERAGLVEVQFARKTGERGGRPAYAHAIAFKS
jgi:hypothetical protein